MKTRCPADDPLWYAKPCSLQRNDQMEIHNLRSKFGSRVELSMEMSFREDTPSGERNDLLARGRMLDVTPRRRSSHLSVLSSMIEYGSLFPEEEVDLDAKQEVQHPSVIFASVLDVDSVEFLQSGEGQVFQGCLVCAFIVFDILQGLSMQHAAKSSHFTKQTLIVSTAALSAVVGSVITVAMRGVHGLMDTLNLADLLAFAVPGGLFSISQTTKLFAVSLSDAGTVKVFSQLKIIITGVFAGTVLGQRFSLTQWQTMILLLTLLVSFAVASDSGGAGDHKNLHLGILFATLSTLFTCIAGLITEKFLKASTLPFYSQRIGLELMGLPWAVLMLFAVPACTYVCSNSKLARFFNI